MSRKCMRRVELWPALDGVLRLSCLALVLTAAGLGWACAASLKGSQAPATTSAEGGWWWFTDDAFHAPSPAEQEQLSDFGTVRQRLDPNDPEVEIEKPPAGTSISCPFDVSIRFRPGRDPKDPSHLVPIDLHSVTVIAKKVSGFPRGTKKLEMEFSDSGFSKAGVSAPKGKYQVLIAFTDKLGRTARAQADFTIEN